MDLEAEKRIIDRIRRVQRAWDTSKTIPQEHIDHWIYIATNAPSKQDEAYFNLYVITDRGTLDMLVDHTVGFTVPVIPERGVWGNIRNTQMCGSAYLLATYKKPKTMREFWPDGTLHNDDDINRQENALMSIGIAMALIAQSAASLGYATGFNRNHGITNSPSMQIWRDTCGIGSDEQIAFGLGIGFPRPGVPRNHSDETKVWVGAWPSRVYDITKDKHIEHEGVSYPLPTQLGYPTFSERGPKDINIKMI